MSTGAEIQNHIDVLIKSEKISVNVYSLLKSQHKVDAISKAREELEKYYVKNFKEVKGFFQVSFASNNGSKLISTILGESELQETVSDNEKNILEINIVAIASVEQNITAADVKLAISNADWQGNSEIQLSRSTKRQQESSKQDQVDNNLRAHLPQAINQQQSSTTSGKSDSFNSKSLGQHGIKRKLVDSDEDDDKFASKQLKKSSPVENLQIQKLSIQEQSMEVEKKKTNTIIASDDDDESDDNEFIAMHLKRTAQAAAQAAAKSQVKDEKKPLHNTLPQKQLNNKDGSGSKNKGSKPAVAANNKITSFFKKN